jgi:hypothetical protein
MDEGVVVAMDGLNVALREIAVRLSVAGPREEHREIATSQRPLASDAGPDPLTANLDLTELLAMPLDRFMREGQLLEVRVPWLDVTLWFVPEEADAGAIERTGTGRGRVWTASELIELMAMPNRTAEVVEMITRAKLAVDGDLVEVRPRPAPEPR